MANCERTENKKAVGNDEIPSEVYKFTSERLLTSMSIFLSGCMLAGKLLSTLMHVVIMWRPDSFICTVHYNTSIVLLFTTILLITPKILTPQQRNTHFQIRHHLSNRTCLCHLPSLHQGGAPNSASWWNKHKTHLQLNNIITNNMFIFIFTYTCTSHSHTHVHVLHSLFTWTGT